MIDPSLVREISNLEGFKHIPIISKIPELKTEK